MVKGSIIRNLAKLSLVNLIDSLETIPCPICGSTEYEKIYQGPAYRGYIQLTCVICTHCTHLYLNPRPSLKAYAEFYNRDDYGKFIYASKKRDYSERSKAYDEYCFQERTGHGRRLYNEYLKNILKENDIVFDFGAGDGAWLFGLREASGCKIDGNEASSLHVQFIKKRMGLDIFLGPIEELENQIIEKYKGKVKVAIVSGSLQHMVDPMKCLRIASSVLVCGGYLYICNWNFFDYMSLQSKNPKTLRELLSIDHPHYFHKNSYLFMVEKAGFQVLTFKPVSTIRARPTSHMEVFARKASMPREVSPEIGYDGILSRIANMESNVKHYRAFSLRYNLHTIKSNLKKLIGI